MGRAIQLGKIFGIPFRLDYSWFLIFIFITVLLSSSYFPDFAKENDYSWSPAAYWILGLITSLLFFASVLTHELAHSVVGIRSGIPVKSITLFFFGGVAHIGKEASRPTTELKMAAAGPLSSMALAALFYGLFLLSNGFNIEYLAALTWWLAMINGILAIFNMIPGFPLDGGRVLRSIVWLATGNYMRATRIATMAGYGVSYLFILGGIFMLFFLRGGWFNGLWFIFIGFFLNSAVRTTYRQSTLRDSLKGFTAQDVMTRDLPSVPRNITIRELVQRQLFATSSQCFMVSDGEMVQGLLTLHQIKDVPKEYWDITTTGQAMTPVENLKMVRPGDDAISVLERMDEENLNQVTVVREGRIIGMVLRDNLIRFTQRLRELKA
ncbi:MAG: site-2 protease family protein [Dehalococcoidia bacterium]|nr:site-2 protease family protein [Dehalococcoidia bacterium]